MSAVTTASASLSPLSLLCLMPTTFLASARVQQGIFGHDRWRILGSLNAAYGLHIHSHRVFVARRRVTIRWLFARMFHMLHNLDWGWRSLCCCCRSNWFAGRKWWCSRCSLCVCRIVGSRWHWWCRRRTSTCTMSLSPCHCFEKLRRRCDAREYLNGQTKVYSGCLRLHRSQFYMSWDGHTPRSSVNLPLTQCHHNECRRVQRPRMRE